eukprot:4950884-Amphidinium_carterae.1
MHHSTSNNFEVALHGKHGSAIERTCSKGPPRQRRPARPMKPRTTRKRETLDVDSVQSWSMYHNNLNGRDEKHQQLFCH